MIAGCGLSVAGIDATDPTADGGAIGADGGKSPGQGNGDGGTTSPDAKGPDVGTPDAAARCPYEEEVLADQPTTWLHLDEEAGTTAVSAVSTGARGTFEGTVGYRRPGATCGGFAIAFNGSDTRVSLGATQTFPDAQSHSIEVWAQRGSGTDDNNTRRIFAFGPAPAGSRPFFSVQVNANLGAEGTLFQRLPVAAGNDSYAHGPALAVDTWTHVVAVVDATNVRLYLNGVMTEQSARHPFTPEPGSELVLADVPGFAGFKWKGLLDELAIYDKALDATRVKAHYDAGHR